MISLTLFTLLWSHQCLVSYSELSYCAEKINTITGIQLQPPPKVAAKFKNQAVCLNAGFVTSEIPSESALHRGGRELAYWAAHHTNPALSPSDKMICLRSAASSSSSERALTLEDFIQRARALSFDFLWSVGDNFCAQEIKKALISNGDISVNISCALSF